ncbi:MAG: UTP--glucose-1-phosphate uridylyltransferase [Bradymonadales bacterium]|nr:MAG: UTP--glucose-1-phosphate uridylyltransferase [Bradymonadales bacterium]
MFPAVIPVAGVGTRSLPASKVVPKELMPVFDRPIVQHIVEELVSSGAKRVVFVSSRGKSLIEDHFDRQPELEAFLESRGKSELLQEVRRLSDLIEVSSVRQKEAKGLGHAVGMARDLIQSSHFFVLLGDEMTVAKPSSVEQLLQVLEAIPSSEREGSGVVMLMKVGESEVSKYGICELQDGRVKKCLEKPQASQTNSRWAITGRYLLPRTCFEHLKSLSAGAGGEIQLTDALQCLAEEGKLYPCYFEGDRFDAGDRLGFLKANLHFYLKSEMAGELKDYLRGILK